MLLYVKGNIMLDKLKIDIVSDVVCPWCIIGYKRLEKAIEELGIQDKIQIEWHPFELNPDLAEPKNVYKHMYDRYNMDELQVKAYQDDRTKDGKNLGFEFNYSLQMNVVDTRDAHVMLDFAKAFGKQTQLKLRLFSAHFSEKKDISKQDVLLKELEAVGLDVVEAKKRLNKSSRDMIEQKEMQWHQKGVSAVPTMFFDNNQMMNGAYPIEIYKQVLREFIDE